MTETQPAPTATRLVAGAELPASGQWQIDPGHTEVAFIGRHFMLTKVRGRFTGVTGVIVVAGEPGASTAEVTIDMASVDSGSQARDDHLRSPDFFDTDRHPTATFTGHAADWRGTQGLLAGELTIRGVTRPVTLQTRYLGHVADPWGGQRAMFTAEGTLNREDWGLTWNMPLDNGGLLVSKEIHIEIEAEAAPASSAARLTTAPPMHAQPPTRHPAPRRSGCSSANLQRTRSKHAAGTPNRAEQANRARYVRAARAAHPVSTLHTGRTSAMSFTRTRSAAGLALLAALAAGCGTGLTAYHAARPAAPAHHATPNPAATAHHHAPGMMHAAAEPAVAQHHRARPVHHPAATPAAPPATGPAQTANPIPQGNGGDQDADNNGGPSDGDGNI